MLSFAIALCSTEIPLGDLGEVSGILQAQVQQFSQQWGVTATITSCATPAEKPPGAWPIIVTSHFDLHGNEGIHVDTNNQPTAYVIPDQHWIVSVSHEMLEMLFDPAGARMSPGPALDGSPRTLQYLMEVCDPVQFITYGIAGCAVCDFVLPAYYQAPTPGARYDFAGSDQLDGPLRVTNGGYLSFQDGGIWRQLRVDLNGNQQILNGPAVGNGPPPMYARSLTHEIFKTYEIEGPPLTEEDLDGRPDRFFARSAEMRRGETVRLRTAFPVIDRILLTHEMQGSLAQNVQIAKENLSRGFSKDTDT